MNVRCPRQTSGSTTATTSVPTLHLDLPVPVRTDTTSIQITALNAGKKEEWGQDHTPHYRMEREGGLGVGVNCAVANLYRMLYLDCA